MNMARADFRWLQVWRKRGRMALFLVTLAWLVLFAGSVPPAAGNWPQFMRDSAHTGDAADEALRLSLALVAQVRLDDAVMTSPAVVGGLAYVVDQMGTAYCIDARAGKVVWKASPDGAAAMGANSSSPCVAQGRLCFGTTAGTFHILDIVDGRVVKTLNIGSPIVSSPTFANGCVYFGCDDGYFMYFTAGAGDYKLGPGEKIGGEAIAIEAKTGKVLWRSTDPFGSTYPVLAGDRLLLNEYFGDLSCVSAADGKLLWKRKTSGYSRFSVGPDFLVMRGYGGHGAKVRLEDGKDYPDCRELGGDLHACGAVALTPEFSFAITLGGLNVREVRTGKLLWESPGFAPRACVNPVLANGRVFWTSAASGMIYCFEPYD